MYLPSSCFLGTIWRNSQNLFALVGLERISKNHPNLEIKEITVSCCNCFMWWYEINCSEILWVHTIYLHMSCKYALITKTFSSWPETWDTPKYLDICWYISVDRRSREKSKSYLIVLRFLLCLFVSVGWNLLDFYTLISNEPDIDRIVLVLLLIFSNSAPSQN